jgi:hypothetical protein
MMQLLKEMRNAKEASIDMKQKYTLGENFVMQLYMYMGCK